MDKPILEAHNITHWYEAKKPILSDLQLTVKAGDTVAICGTSGVGKTTLLEILGTMRHPQKGAVEINGRPVYGKGAGERARIRGNWLGFVFQEGLLLPDLTIWENCRLALSFGETVVSEKEATKRFTRLMEALDLDPDRKTSIPAELSTGERQRVAVVRALMHQPGLIIADEPTGNLDPASSDSLLDLLLPLTKKREVGLLVATHDRRLAESMAQCFKLEAGSLHPL